VADLHILREHSLGLTEARKIAFRWAEYAEKAFDMTCVYEEGEAQDEVCFTRPGVQGRLSVTQNKFEINAQLGFLLSTFKSSIERDIVKKLDDFLKGKPQAKAHRVKVKT
jgi:putative polyhydroxyalkanoate system protein